MSPDSVSPDPVQVVQGTLCQFLRTVETTDVGAKWIIEALREAGLLVTDEQRAVIEAAREWAAHLRPEDQFRVVDDLEAAVAALEATP